MSLWLLNSRCIGILLENFGNGMILIHIIFIDLNLTM